MSDDSEARELLISPPGCSAPTTAASPPDQDTPLARSQAAFLRDLPDLLAEHCNEWVAYANGRRVKLAKSQAELYRHCLHDLGLTHDRFVVRRIAPRSSPHVEYSLP